MPNETTTTNSGDFRIHEVYLIIIAILLLLMGIGYWITQRQTNKLVGNITSYNDSIKSFYKLKDGTNVASKNSLQLQTESQLKSMIAKNKDLAEAASKFKEVKAVTVIKTVFVLKHDTIPFETKIPCAFTPFQLVKEEKRKYKIFTTISNSALVIDSLIIPDSLSMIFGRKRTGFLKWDYAVDIMHTNSYLQTSNVSDYRYIPEKKWYERPFVSGSIGFGLGFLTNSILANRTGLFTIK